MYSLSGASDLEMCHTVNVVLLDKTGTITEGRPVVGCTHMAEGSKYDVKEFYGLISSAEVRNALDGKFYFDLAFFFGMHVVRNGFSHG
jgi:high-affinity K+ transport system ATPase subunit B